MNQESPQAQHENDELENNQAVDPGQINEIEYQQMLQRIGLEAQQMDEMIGDQVDHSSDLQNTNNQGEYIPHISQSQSQSENLNLH